MPCRDYYSDDAHDWHREAYKAQCDKLARIACAAMTELEQVGKAEFLVLRNEEVRDWWEEHKEADRKERARIAEIERRKRVKEEALSRLTEEEKEILGLNKGQRKRTKIIDARTLRTKEVDVWEDDTEYDEEEISDLIEKASRAMKR